MAQSSHTFNDVAGLAHLAELNAEAEANATLNSGPTEPATKYAGMLWLDTSGATPVLKQRNQANDGWDAVSALLDAEVMPSPTAGGYRKRKADNSGDETVAAQTVADELTPLLPLVGVGQTWQNLLASRASDVTYVNSTGAPITVIVNVTGGGAAPGSATYVVKIDGVTMYSPRSIGADVRECTTFIVPDGSNYLISVASGALLNWWELR